MNSKTAMENKNKIKNYLLNPDLLYSNIGYKKTTFFQILNTEFQKYGRSFLNIFDIKNLFNCGDHEAYSIIYIYTQKYGLLLPKECEIIRWELENNQPKKITHPRHPGDDVVVKTIAEKYNEKGKNFLNYKNIMKLFGCGDVRARAYIKLFCQTYKLECPLQSNKTVDTAKNRKKIINAYNKKGISVLTTAFVRKKLNCNRQTATKVIRNVCQELQIAYPLGTHKKRDFYEDYIVFIDKEYNKNGVDCLSLNIIAPLAEVALKRKDSNTFRMELARHIRHYAKLYEIDIRKLNLKVKRW